MNSGKTLPCKILRRRKGKTSRLKQNMKRLQKSTAKTLPFATHFGIYRKEKNSLRCG
jgi:hypothetical protein